MELTADINKKIKLIAVISDCLCVSVSLFFAVIELISKMSPWPNFSARSHSITGMVGLEVCTWRS